MRTEVINERVGVAVKCLTPLQVVLFSILGKDTGHPDFRFRGYTQSLQANSDTPMSTFSRFFAIHHSSVILLFNSA
jgi:hypothetical protein